MVGMSNHEVRFSCYRLAFIIIVAHSQAIWNLRDENQRNSNFKLFITFCKHHFHCRRIGNQPHSPSSDDAVTRSLLVDKNNQVLNVKPPVLECLVFTDSVTLQGTLCQWRLDNAALSTQCRDSRDLDLLPWGLKMCSIRGLYMPSQLGRSNGNYLWVV